MFFLQKVIAQDEVGRLKLGTFETSDEEHPTDSSPCHKDKETPSVGETPGTGTQQCDVENPLMPCLNDLDEDNYDDATCMICLEPFRVGNTVSWSKRQLCPHVFHTDCIMPWLLEKRNDDCPTCRTQLMSFIQLHDENKRYNDEHAIQIEDCEDPNNDDDHDSISSSSSSSSSRIFVIFHGLISSMTRQTSYKLLGQQSFGDEQEPEDYHRQGSIELQATPRRSNVLTIHTNHHTQASFSDNRLSIPSPFRRVVSHDPSILRRQLSSIPERRPSLGNSMVRSFWSFQSRRTDDASTCQHFSLPTSPMKDADDGDTEEDSEDDLILPVLSMREQHDQNSVHPSYVFRQRSSFRIQEASVKIKDTPTPALDGDLEWLSPSKTTTGSRTWDLHPK